jgi:hypothetical protein
MPLPPAARVSDEMQALAAKTGNKENLSPRPFLAKRNPIEAMMQPLSPRVNFAFGRMEANAELDGQQAGPSKPVEQDVENENTRMW